MVARAADQRARKTCSCARPGGPGKSARDAESARAGRDCRYALPGAVAFGADSISGFARLERSDQSAGTSRGFELDLPFATADRKAAPQPRNPDGSRDRARNRDSQRTI